MQPSVMRCDSQAGAGSVALSVSQRLFRDKRRTANRRSAAPSIAEDKVGNARRRPLRNWSGATHGMKPRLTRSQKATIFSGINLIVTLMVVLQLWLLTATMNAWMGGDTSVVWPAMLASLGCLLVNLWLLRRVFYLQEPVE